MGRELARADIVFRPFAPDDTEAVVALWESCGLTRPWNDPHKDVARKLRIQPEWFLVAVQDDEIVGTAMAGYDGHRGWVNYLAVAPSARGRGLGRALMEEVEALLRAADCAKINIQVRRENAAALAFYEAIGYAVDDVVSLGRRLVRDDE